MANLNRLRYERVADVNTMLVQMHSKNGFTRTRCTRDVAALYSDNNLQRGDRTFRVDNDLKLTFLGKWSNFCKLIRVKIRM